MTARRLAAACAALLAAAPAGAYVRTTAEGTGKGLFWPNLSVGFRVNAASRAGATATSPSCQASGAADPALDAVRAGFAAWEQSCTNLRLVYGGTTGDIATGLGGTGGNIVVFRKGWCSQNTQAENSGCRTNPDVECSSLGFNCFEDPGGMQDWNTLALTSVLYVPSTGQIVDADIEVNDWDGLVNGSTFTTHQHAWYFTCGDKVGKVCESYGEADCYYIDLLSTVTHEAGHVIGLAHAQDPNATMYATTSPGNIEMRSLSADDIAGVCAIYSSSAPLTPPSSNDDGCGCGSTGAAGLVPFLVAALALRRRPVRRR